MQAIASKLNWFNARELVEGGFFSHQKNGKNKNQRKTKIRLLFNGCPSDRDEIRKQLQTEMRQYNESIQVWLARLQTAANPTK
eukprot:143507-Ditylum_brightwellii.AAC.1